ncbi:MAG: helical backbone metal receptor [Thermodesulfobacteriota bacterium]|nr:helical backbone metal receptor [Thermodesulfobacteriota bacterium]
MGVFRKRTIGALAAILGLVVCLALLTSCQGDALDAQEACPEPILRAVSLGPNITETIFALGQGHCLVGVSDFDNFPSEARALPRVGGYVNPNLERLLALRPDLILLHGKHEKVDTFCRDKGIRVVHVAMESLSSVFSAITQLGEVFQCPQRAARLCRNIGEDLGALRKKVSVYQRPRVFVCLWRSSAGLSGLGTAGKGSYVGELLEAAGGGSIFEDVAVPYPEVSKESLIKRKPEIILELRPGEEVSHEQKRALISDWQVLRTVPAVQSGRIHILTDDFLLVPGPRMGLAVRAIAQALHPEMDGDE